MTVSAWEKFFHFPASASATVSRGNVRPSQARHITIRDAFMGDP